MRMLELLQINSLFSGDDYNNSNMLAGKQHQEPITLIN